LANENLVEETITVAMSSEFEDLKDETLSKEDMMD
jgi:hypothetical protein